MRRLVVAITAMLAVLCIAGAGWAGGHFAPDSKPLSQVSAHLVTSESSGVQHTDGLGLGPYGVLQQELRRQALVLWYTTISENRKREEQAVRARARQVPPAATRPGPSSSSSQAVGGSCAAMKPAGFPDYIINRESGGDPSADNGSHYGCVQLDYSYLSGNYAADWARLYAGGAGLCHWQPPNYCGG